MEDKERKEANKKYERARKEELGLPDSSPEEEENAGGAGMATNNFLTGFFALAINLNSSQRTKLVCVLSGRSQRPLSLSLTVYSHMVQPDDCRLHTVVTRA